MQSQEEYNGWMQRMVERHCPALFKSIVSLEHNGIRYLDALADDPRGEKYHIHLSTYGRELTVSCQAFHTHLDQFADDDHEREFQAAVEWIENFRRDRIVIFTHRKGEKVVSTMAAEPSYRVATSEGEEVHVFSFSGALDRIIT